MGSGISDGADKNRINKKNPVKSHKVFCYINAGVLLMLFIYLTMTAGLKEFWYDEVALIGYIRSNLTLGDVLHYYQTIEATNTPLYALIVYGFYHLFPPENIWILLPGILMTLFGVWRLVQLADRTLGRGAAYAAMIMCASSTTIINRIALELRAYALLFAASVLTIDCLLRLKDHVNGKTLFLTSLSMVMLAYSHYFGVLYLLVLGMEVFIYIICNKKDPRLMLPFIISAVTFLPWFFVTMHVTNIDTATFWIQPPGLLELPETIGYLLGGSYLLCILYGIGFLWILYSIVNMGKRRQTAPALTGDKCRNNRFDLVLYGLTGPIVMAAVFLYSRWINPGGGLYENRYFIVILPCILLTASYGMKMIMETGNGEKKKILTAVGVIFLIIVCVFGVLRSLSGSRQQYARYSYSADQIIKNDDIGNSDVLLVCTSYDDVGYAVLEGWYDYYLLRRGYEAANLLMTGEGSLDTVLNNLDSYRKIYVVGDTDHITYEGEEYIITQQEEFYKFTVLERQYD